MYFQKEPKEFKTAEDINEFIAVENPYERITEKEKLIIITLLSFVWIVAYICYNFYVK